MCLLGFILIVILIVVGFKWPEYLDLAFGLCAIVVAFGGGFISVFLGGGKGKKSRHPDEFDWWQDNQGL